MCGWVGVLDPKGGVDVATLKAMADRVQHRGPDDEGYWVAPRGEAGFGFRRLSILDLSPAGHQPMPSPRGRFTGVLNGEIYNFQTLRQELLHQGFRFRGTSDTEVMLGAFEAWGIPASLRRFNGMFSLGVWDDHAQCLTLARDRFGKKPLYLARCESLWLMGSELKSFKPHPAFRAQVALPVLGAYLESGYVPGPHAIYEGVHKLAPGHLVTLRPGDDAILPQPFWQASDLLGPGHRHGFRGTPDEALEALDEVARDAVRLRMISDVPLGAFLSGGIDSSLVVALMQAQSPRPVRTFTIGFEEPAYDEAPFAKALARRIGTDHTEMVVSAREAMAVIPELATIYDEPLGDASQLPTLLVSRLARQQVTVVLSGDGGDELFGGYGRYFRGDDLHRHVAWLPQALRAGLRQALLGLAPERWDRILQAMRWALPGRLGASLNGDRLHKVAALLGQHEFEELYLALTRIWSDATALLPGTAAAPGWLDAHPGLLEPLDPLEKMMFLDTMTYLPDDILVKVDRASMAASLEARAPLLDLRVAELAWSLPTSWKINRQGGKQILRRLAYRYVPRELLDRPKMGFGMPVGLWLKAALRPWAEDLLTQANLETEGLAARPIRQAWQEHLQGSRNWEARLWALLMYLSWKRASNKL